jgi:hypothetical protein
MASYVSLAVIEPSWRALLLIRHESYRDCGIETAAMDEPPW